MNPFCWLARARIFSQWSSVSLPHEKPDTSRQAENGSGTDRTTALPLCFATSLPRRRRPGHLHHFRDRCSRTREHVHERRKSVLTHADDRFSINTSSAARTAASRTKSAREQPRLRASGRLWTCVIQIAVEVDGHHATQSPKGYRALGSGPIKIFSLLSAF